MPQMTVRDFFERNQRALDLELIAGQKGLYRELQKFAVVRPGLHLAGFVSKSVSFVILVLGDEEVSFMKKLSSSQLAIRLKRMLTSSTLAVIFPKKQTLDRQWIDLCNQRDAALFLSSCPTEELTSRLFHVIEDLFAPETQVHGTMVEVFGQGLLIQGEPGIGKSESALGLLERGHRLIADDVVHIRREGWNHLIATGSEFGRYHMEIRGVGLIHALHLFGAGSVRKSNTVDLIVRLEEWDGVVEEDRTGLQEKFLELLGVSVPFHTLAPKQERDVVLLLETLSLNKCLKNTGEHTAREFRTTLRKMIHQKRSKREVL
jgi:HPr kinase/phosphorylase